MAGTRHNSTLITLNLKNVKVYKHCSNAISTADIIYIQRDGKKVVRGDLEMTGCGKFQNYF
jgi:hypothetical protein